MKMRLRGMSLLAAVTIAGAGLIAAPQAYAAPSPDSAKLCTGATVCSINYPTSVHNAGVDEGTSVKATIKGNKNVTIKVRVFSVKPDGGLAPAGPETPVTTDKDGVGTASASVDVIKAPMVGGEHFTVQPADATDPKALIGSVKNKVEFFTVNSARAMVTKVDDGPFKPGTLYSLSVDGGIIGDRYVFQVKVGAEWRTLNHDEKTGTIKMGPLGSKSTALSWTAPSLSNGTYEVRIMNSRNSEIVWTNELVFGGQAAPAPSTTPKPSTSTKPSTAPTAPAKKDDKGGLAKTGN